MDFNYTKIKLGNWLFKNCFPLYNFSYSRFKLKNDFHEINTLKKIIQPGNYVLDIGANIGFYAKILSGLVGEKGKVFCFEPDKTNFKYLKKNVGHLSNVILFNNAVSDKKDVIKIYKSKLLNVDHRTYPVNNYDSVEEINAISIDELIQDKTIAKVDVIKIDIQGYELFAFNGMLNLLQSNTKLKIVAEYWPHGFKRAGTSAIEFFDFFDKLDYQFSILENEKLLPLTKQYVVEQNEKPFEFSFNVLIEKKK
ncbi:MAG: FkbM family methyltransferase [Bacteroidota bacterium]|nr:FkbM family methyltransferase [Bacteroidota bacterium]MDP3144770.1 FkbM family methyltransferase [Bacteroidota bacterium]